jgi:hypothetical protein
MDFRLNFLQTLLRFYREYERGENCQLFHYSIFLNKLLLPLREKRTPSYLTKSPPNSNFQNSFYFLRSYFMSSPFIQLFKHRIQYRSFLCSFFSTIFISLVPIDVLLCYKVIKRRSIQSKLQ